MPGLEGKTDTILMKEFFGYPPGGNASDFVKEMKALPEEDKKQLANGLRDGSLTY